MDIWSTISRADQALFSLINYEGHSGYLDWLMLLLREPYAWVPLYLFLMVLVYRQNPSALLPFFTASLLTVAVTDYTSASIIKPFVARLRPCYTAGLQEHIYVLTGCGGKYSFPSTHASNHFGLATCWYGFMRMTRNLRWNWVWIWALAVGYAQIYVGKHFPLDIAAGALLGVATGTWTTLVFKGWFLKSASR
jgi:undecaprenyl-diphosphatase